MDRFGVPEAFATTWVAIDGVAEASMVTTRQGQTDCADMIIERRSDGARVALRAMTAGSALTVRTSDIMLIGERTEEYRLLLNNTCFGLHAVEDIEILRDERDSDFTRATASADETTIVDLRTMSRGLAVPKGHIVATPNPARTEIALTWNVRQLPRTTAARVRLEIVDTRGHVLFTNDVTDIGRTVVSVSTWPPGAYAVRLYKPSDVSSMTTAVVIVAP